MPNWYKPEEGSIAAFEESIAAARAADNGSAFTSETFHGIPVYDCNDLRGRIVSAAGETALREDWFNVMEHGSGVVVLKNCFEDVAPVDAATGVFEQIMADERRKGAGKGDHFGSNERIWNAAEKLCLADPEAFARYYANQMIALVSEAWLGPNYQITSQTNLVHPDGQGQVGHRDYHMGFMKAEDAARYPVTAHAMSPHLTLQGAVAHCDMPVDSGPTKYLPYSQHYAPGYIATSRPEFSAYFEDNFVQMPLAKGDAVFFNPAVMHGAGSNVTQDVHRLANLLQVGSAFGRSIETVDRTAMCRVLYRVLQRLHGSGALAETEVMAVIAASAEGYAFPTNLDRDLPAGGLAPRSQADIMIDALERGLKHDAFVRELDALARRRQTDASDPHS